MSRAAVQFSTSVFSVDVSGIGAHCNPVPCVLTGRGKSVTIASREEVVTGDIVLIRPGIEHTVICNGGITVMYLDGLPWSGSSLLADRLQGRLADSRSTPFSKDQRLKRRCGSGLSLARRNSRQS